MQAGMQSAHEFPSNLTKSQLVLNPDRCRCRILKVIAHSVHRCKDNNFALSLAYTNFQIAFTKP